MKLVKYLFFASFVFCCQTTGSAQPEYNLRFELVSANGSEYVVDIIMSYTSAGQLGTSNLVFSYNGNDISSPVLLAHGLSNHYSNPTITTPASNTASLNIELNTINNGIAIGVFPSETNLARVSFTIDDPPGNSNLQWLPSHPLHVVFLSDETNILAPGVLQGLNTSPLPVELVSFRANVENTSILLTWHAANEYNLAGYELQRSVDGSRFEKIAWMPARGNSSESDYRYPDEAVIPGTQYYYRLKPTDLDGQYSFSRVVSASLSSGGLQFHVFPNPNSGEFTVVFPEIQEDAYHACLYDHQGRIVWETAIIEGGSWKPFGNRLLPPGVYSLQVSGNGFVRTEQVIVR